MRTKYENIQNVFHTMKVNYEKAIQVNNELKINVDEQHVDMKHFKEKCDKDDEEKNRPVCVTCNTKFAIKIV